MMHHTTKRSARRRRTRPWVSRCALLVLGALTAACGSQLSDETLLAHARGEPLSGSSSLEGGGSGSGGGPAGDVGEDLAGTADSTVPVDAGAPDRAAAPGGAAEEGATGGSAAPGDAGAQCTGNEPPIKIGAVGEQTGIVGSFLADGPRAVAAWAAAMNAKGGLRCHEVSYVIEDDGGDPSRHQSQVRRLVEEDDVIAFVHMNATIAGEASVPYLTDHQIPVVGTEGGSPWVYESPVFFPQMGSGDLALAAGVASLADVGGGTKRKLATMSCVEASICSGLNDIAPALAKQFGVDLVYRGQVSLAQPDFTSNCQAAQRAGADLMLIALDPNAVQRVLRSCGSVGFRPIYATGGPIPTPNLPSDPNTNGMIIATTFVPFTVSDNPVVAEYLDTLARYSPGARPSFSGMAGYISAKLFQVAVEGISGEVTSESILASVSSIQGNDLSGATYPMTFQAGRTAPKTFCYWTAQIRDGKYQSLDGSPRVCP